MATTIAMLVSAVLAPLLGALADVTAAKKRFLATFLVLGVLCTGAMFWIERGDWLFALLVFGAANICISSSFVFYDSLLPTIAKPDELDRVSTAGYALGYVGGGLLLALNLAWITKPEWFGLPSGEGLTPEQKTLPARLAFFSVAVWWLVFALPLLLRVPEPPRQREADERAGDNPLLVAVTRLRETFGELKRYRDAFLLLIAFLAFNDGIGTIIRMAAIYGEEIGLKQNSMIAAILIVQFVGIPFAFLFGALAGRIGAKRSILIGLAVYLGICVLAWRMSTTAEFFALAVLVAAVQGGCQSLSRSLFASMVPRHKSGEFFGLFAVLERFAGVLGPAAFFFATRATGSSRAAIISLVLFFLVGGVLLLRVDVAEGQRAAREADEGLEMAEGG